MYILIQKWEARQINEWEIIWCLKILFFLYSYVVPLEYYYVLLTKPFMVILDMNILRAATKKVEEEKSIVGDNDNQALPHDNQMPQVDEVTMGDLVPVAPLQWLMDLQGKIFSLWHKT